MKPFLKFTVALACFGLASCAGKPVAPESRGEAAPKDLTPLVGTIQVARFVLDNGLKLLVVEDHSSPTFAYQTWFKVGSRDENPGYTGLAHLFEHMMFKQTKNLADGEFDRILEQAGAEGENAFTNRDYTAYVQEMPRSQLELIARLEADRMVNLIVDEKAFKTETEVVQNERRYRNENSPDGIMYQELFEQAFTKHPYHWPVIGYQADLDRMSAKEAVEFYRSYYAPNHATVIIAGDVTPAEALATVRKHYGALASQPAPVRVIETEPQQASARHKLLRLNMKTEKLMMGYRIPAITHEDIPAIGLIQSLLSGGKSSRLYRALVVTGIATSCEAYGLDDKDPTLFLIGCDMQKGKKAAQAEKAILRELARLTQERAGEKEIERAKNIINFDFYGALDNNSSRARILGTYEAIAGGFEKGLEIQKKTLATTAPEIMAVAKRYFQPTNRTVITGVPK